MLHNHDDILQLYRLLKVLEKCDLHKALHHLGFPVTLPQSNAPGLQVDKIILSGNALQIAGSQRGHKIDYRVFANPSCPYTITFDRLSAAFQVALPVIRRSGMSIIDLKAMNIDLAPFEKYPTYGEGLLIIDRQGKKSHLEINHFIKRFLERILNQWIIKP